MTAAHRDGPGSADHHPRGQDVAQLGAPPPAARRVFGARLPLAEQFAELLARDAVVQGLIGPREISRLWDRHLLNSAVVTDLLPSGAHVVDVGSGAGLPGIAMAIRRPDLRVVLLEPMLRRTRFLTDVTQSLAISDTVRVVRGRAEEASVRDCLGPLEWVVARAVAALDRLGMWCLPLLAPGGRLLAMKGAGAAAEVTQHRQALRRHGADEIALRELGGDLLAEPSRVVVVTRGVASRKVRGTGT